MDSPFWNCYVHGISHYAQLLQKYLLTEQNDHMEVELGVKSQWLAQSILHSRFLSTIALKKDIQELRIVVHRLQTISIAEHLEEQISNSAIPERILVDVQRCSEDQHNLLCYKVVDRQSSAVQKLSFIHLRLLPRHLLLHFTPEFIFSGDRVFHNLYQDGLYKKTQMVQLLLKLGRIEQTQEGMHDAAVNGMVVHFCKANSRKKQKIYLESRLR